MEIVIAAVVVALGLAAGLVAAGHPPAQRGPRTAGGAARPAPPPARKPAGREDEALARSAEIGRQEERLVGREEALDTRVLELEAREQRVADREIELDELRERQVRELE